MLEEIEVALEAIGLIPFFPAQRRVFATVQLYQSYVQSVQFILNFYNSSSTSLLLRHVVTSHLHTPSSIPIRYRNTMTLLPPRTRF